MSLTSRTLCPQTLPSLFLSPKPSPQQWSPSLTPVNQTPSVPTVLPSEAVTGLASQIVVVKLGINSFISRVSCELKI